MAASRYELVNGGVVGAPKVEQTSPKADDGPKGARRKPYIEPKKLREKKTRAGRATKTERAELAPFVAVNLSDRRDGRA